MVYDLGVTLMMPVEYNQLVYGTELASFSSMISAGATAAKLGLSLFIFVRAISQVPMDGFFLNGTAAVAAGAAFAGFEAGVGCDLSARCR